jgi:mono/diheme cytochrome c family protein
MLRPGNESGKEERKMRRKKMARLTWMTLTFTICIAPFAMAASDQDAGRDLAATWCSSCHLIEQKTAAATQARPLAAIARDGRWTADALRGFLARPHGGMPDLNLTRQEIENLAAYIDSLAP